MKVTIHDVPSAYSNRTQRLSKSSIDLATAPYAILVLRISLGLLFLAHGCLKVFTFTLPGTAQFFESVGLPGGMATPVAIAEIGGGLLLISGIYTRWVALGLFPILLVATFKVHGANGWLFTNKGGGWEFPAFFALACIVQFLLGDGAYAIGSIFHRKPVHTDKR
jgi:putative oxidoreductase